MKPFLARILDEPSYGWVSEQNRPSDTQIRRELLRSLDPRDRRRWLGALTWASHLGLIALVPIYLLSFATPLGIAAGLLYALLFLPCWGTVYLHRYCTHRAFQFRSRFWASFGKHIAIQLIPEELYVVSHHVHHHFADRDGDPYDPRGGWWYCFLADANHQRIAQDLSPEDYTRVSNLLAAAPIYRNTHEQYLRWGSVASPLRTALSFGANWLLWYALLWLLGGHSLAMGIFAMSSLWLVGIRQFNFRAHGRGVDLRIDGEDFHRGDLSVNRTLSAWLAGEWHNNHHLYPRSARAGFLPGQLDLAWIWIRTYALFGVVTRWRDDRESFLRDHYAPWLGS